MLGSPIQMKEGEGTSELVRRLFERFSRQSPHPAREGRVRAARRTASPRAEHGDAGRADHLAVHTRHEPFPRHFGRCQHGERGDLSGTNALDEGRVRESGHVHVDVERRYPRNEGSNRARRGEGD